MFTGTIRVKICEASGLRPTDFQKPLTFGTPDEEQLDPYVAIDVDDTHLAQTTSKQKTFDPEWNESFEHSIEDANTLTLSVFHNTGFPPDDFLASCSISFEELLSKDEDETDFWVNLEPEGKLHIKIDLQLSSNESQGATSKQQKGVHKRRGAVRRRVRQVNGHKFVAKLLREPTLCSHCKEYIRGLDKQGYQCQACPCIVHQRCYSSVLIECPELKDEATAPSQSTALNSGIFQWFGAHNNNYKRFL